MTVCKTGCLMLWYRCPVCPLSVLSVLSVTMVYYGQMVWWIRMPPGTEIGCGPGPHCVNVRWRPSCSCWRTEKKTFNCGMVRFPTGHYWLCSWSVEKASPVVCPWKWWTFWTPFVNKLLQTICIFHLFLVQVASVHRVRFYCVDAWWSTNLPCLTAKL